MSGQCHFSLGDQEAELKRGDVIRLPIGEYSLHVPHEQAEALSVIQVWELPFDV